MYFVEQKNLQLKHYYLWYSIFYIYIFWKKKNLVVVLTFKLIIFRCKNSRIKSITLKLVHIFSERVRPLPVCFLIFISLARQRLKSRYTFQAYDITESRRKLKSDRDQQSLNRDLVKSSGFSVPRFLPAAVLLTL